MNLSKLLRQSLAMLLLIALMVSLVPNVFATEEEEELVIDFDNLQIEVPEELKDEDVVTARFDKYGKIVYEEASPEVRSAVNAGGMTTSAITDSEGKTILENRAGNDFVKAQRLAFFIDPSNSEGNANYSTFSLTAAMVKNLVAAGVTDLFVMTKTRAGTFDMTNLKTANSNKGSAKVYAWMHCARDEAYLKANKNSAQYHFRVGFNNIENGGDTGVSGWVNLGYAAYITYMEGLVGQATAYADGLLLDSVRFGTDYTGWGQEAKDYMGKTNYNNAVKAMCATAGSSNYSYTTGTDGFYKYKAGTSAASGLDLYEIIMKKDADGNAVSPTTAQTNAATSLGNYRKSVITNFIGKMKTKFGTSKIIAVALERDWENTNYYKYIKGQDPYSFRSHVKKGFCVTMQVVDYHNTAPATMAKNVAKYTNVMVGVDFYKVGTVGSYGYTLPDTVTDLAETLFTARYQVAANYKTYRGNILGAACYTMGHVGAVKVSLNNSTATPTMTATVANPNKKTVAMLTYFNKHGDTDCTPSTTFGTDTVLSGTMHYYPQSGYVCSYTPLTNYSVAAFGATTLQVKLKNYNVDWDKLPFIRFGFYPIYDFDSSGNTVAHFPIYIIANHSSCTSFTTTWISDPATCTTKGFKQHKCKTCGYTYIEEVAVTGHTETSAVTKAATCDVAGVRTYTCSVCKATRTEAIAALGHDYKATVTPPTCLEGGYTTYVCSRDASHTYIADEKPATGHTFVGGVCEDCGFTLATLLHFKENAAENTWDWQLIGGSIPEFDTSKDGAMCGTTNGMTRPYFYIEPTGLGNVGHKLVDGDVIQLRVRVRMIQGTATQATPTISLEMASGQSYGTTLSGNSLDLTTNEWQLITIPVTGYTIGDTIERIRIDPLGDQLASAYVEIDYIHFGAPAGVPITVTFYNDDGKVLQESMIAPGTKVTYYGAEPTKRSSAGFIYTFSGWMATEEGSTSGTFITDLSAAAFSKNTALTAQYTYVRGDVEPLDSNKYLVDNDGNLEDYKYDIEIDASTYGQTVTINKQYKKPLDITIVMDRSTSTCFPADESNTSMTWTVTNNTTSLTSVLNKLDTSKPEGYYTATNWLGVDYVGPTDEQAGGYISYEDLKWDGTKWVVWQTLELYNEAPTKYTSALKAIYTDGAYELVRPASVLYKYSNYTYHHTTFGKWVPLATAYTDFFARCKASFGDSWETTHGLSGYKEANMKFKIAVSRRGKMQEALTKFVDSIYASTNQLPAGQYHRVSIVSYGYQAYIKNDTFTFTNAAGSTGTYTCSTDPGVSTSPVTLSSQTNVDNVKKIINKPFAFGATATDQGLKYAAEHQSTMKSSAKTSQGVVILFTDGAPTYGDGFFINTANLALTQANTMKSAGTKIFSVGYMDGLDSKTAVKTWLASDPIPTQANTFLHLVSSNYPAAASMTSYGTGGNSNAGYYMSDTTGLNLATVFGNIYTITDTTTKADTQITGSLIIEDVVTREWDVRKNGTAWDIKVERCDYLGTGEFGKPAAITNTNNSIYTLTTTELANGETKVSLEWHDAPNAWLREKEEATGDYLGYKILLTIGIQLDRDSTIGGNNIPTNTEDSGIFYPTNSDLNHYYKDVPNVNVEMIYDYKIHDYFLDLYNTAAPFDLIDVFDSNGNHTDFTKRVYEDFYTRTVPVDGLNNRFVNIEHFSGEDVYSEYLEAGKTSWAETFYEPEFDFENDFMGIPVRYEVRPITSNIDSLGRTPFAVKKPVRTGFVNFYAPKYAVLDYHTDAVIFMDNETEAKLGNAPTFLSNSGVLDSTGNNMLFTFRNDADNTDERTHILQGIEVIDYTVTAINAPKGAANNTVSRKVHIIPANVVEYDNEALAPYEYVAGSGYTGDWTDDGTHDTTKQNILNNETHGYDSTLVTSGAKNDHSYGYSYKTTVSSNIRDNGVITEYHNNNALTFTFTGTGFDIISQTGPQEGTMVVEAYAVDSTGKVSTTVTKRYLVDNYLSTTNLYQIPVVHCTDLPFGTYKVVIRAFYNEGFNHYTTPEQASLNKGAMVMTEARIRSILGLSEDDVLEYTLSDKRGAAKRAMTATSYDIHIDGVRIFNTLGTISKSGTPVAHATYGQEANANFFAARDLLFDSRSWLAKNENGKTVNGMVYIAGNGIGNTDASAMDGAVHLSMSGILNHEFVDGKYYVLNVNNERVTHPTHKTDIYFKLNSSNQIATDSKGIPVYFCVDASGAEVILTADEFKSIIGSGNIAFFNSTYDVSGPKNEIYLADNYGIAFNAKGATLLQISLNSMDGTTVALEAYNWTAKDFDTVCVATTNRTAMFYNLLPYMDTNGDVIIRNNASGIISISNIKVIGADITAPTATVVRSLTILQGLEFTEPTVSFDENLKVRPSISLGAEMQIVYTITAKDVASYKDFYVEITKEVANGEPIVTVFKLNDPNFTIVPKMKDNGEIGSYQLVYTGISAKEMGDSFTAILYGVDAEGNISCGNTFTSSIKENLMQKLSDEASSAELKTLAVDMLNYGAAAQVNFGYDVENLVNADLTAEQKLLGTQGMAKAVDGAASTATGSKIITSVSLQSKVVLTVNCVYAASETSNVEFVIKDAEGKIIGRYAPNEITEKRCMMNYSDVGARQMRDLLTIELYDNGELVSRSVTWSIESYVAQIRAASDSSEALINIVNAMLIYGDSAAAYLEASNQ